MRAYSVEDGIPDCKLIEKFVLYGALGFTPLWYTDVI